MTPKAKDNIPPRNDEASRDERIAGPKKTAVVNILEMPEECRNMIMDSVSRFGWEGGLSFQTAYYLFLVNPRAKNIGSKQFQKASSIILYIYHCPALRRLQ